MFFEWKKFFIGFFSIIAFVGLLIAWFTLTFLMGTFLCHLFGADLHKWGPLFVIGCMVLELAVFYGIVAGYE